MIKEFIRFLDSSPTAWHAARNCGDRFTEVNSIPLYEDERWELEPGKSYFFLRDESALCAFRMPKKKIERAILLASHLDSPALKLKPIPVLSHPKCTRIMTEVYGSPLLHTWLDRDLCLAGRVVERSSESKLVIFDNEPLIIPSLPMHLDRSVGERGLVINRQEHLQPITAIGHKNPHDLELLLSQYLSWDLFLVPLEKARLKGDLLSSYRLDNLTSAFACLEAMAQTTSSQHTLQLAIFWDHEEVGSQTLVGAQSSLIDQVLDRICLHQEIDHEDFYRIKSRSLCLSVDAAHGYNPNFSDRFDSQNSPFLGEGVIIKSSAAQKYATSASSSAPLFSLAKKKGWNLQAYTSRSDIPAGSTVGPFMATRLGIPTVDLGIATWAMHSIRETVAASDEIALIRFLTAILEQEDFFASKDKNS